MRKALYRKYRSRSLDEVVGQNHITTTLKNALNQGKISHAYLLIGPRGVGKTSVARILAHEINKLEYSDAPHLDIIEIDAASNNGVDDVRDLRDKIMNTPSSAKYKVFIIDEVHMLSKAAFNALLKTLEEPPEHVVFILATTESHKLPATIISRTQRFNFRPVPIESVVRHLQSIATQENIPIDQKALKLVAEHGEGSFRDSISLLDQVSNLNENITSSDVEILLGHPPGQKITSLMDSIKEKTPLSAITIYQELVDQGYEPTIIAFLLGAKVRQKIIENSDYSLLPILRDLLNVPPAYNSGALLEVTILKHSAPTTVNSKQPVRSAPTKTVTSSNTINPMPTPQKQAQSEDEKVQQHTKSTKSHVTSDTNSVPESIDSSSDDDATGLWQQVLLELKQTHNTLYGIGRMASPHLVGDDLTLELDFVFHQKRLSEPRTLDIITKLVEKNRGKKTKVSSKAIRRINTPSKDSETVSTISNIFGGAELLES